MAKLKFLVIHCTATLSGRNITSDDIKRWHMSPKEKGGRGWDRVGYSDMIHINGDLENLTPFNQDNTVDPWEITWGVTGENFRSRHVVYVGGLIYGDDPFMYENNEDVPLVSSDTRTQEQLYVMEVYVRYMIARHPDILVAGHNQFSPKDCPCFNVPEWLRSIGIKEKNIHDPHGK